MSRKPRPIREIVRRTWRCSKCAKTIVMLGLLAPLNIGTSCEHDYKPAKSNARNER